MNICKPNNLVFGCHTVAKKKNFPAQVCFVTSDGGRFLREPDATWRDIKVGLES